MLRKEMETFVTPLRTTKIINISFVFFLNFNSSKMNHQKFQLLKTVLNNNSLIQSRLNKLLYYSQLTTSSAPATNTGNFENRNISKLKDRGLIVSIFPEQK